MKREIDEKLAGELFHCLYRLTDKNIDGYERIFITAEEFKGIIKRMNVGIRLPHLTDPDDGTIFAGLAMFSYTIKAKHSVIDIDQKA